MKTSPEQNAFEVATEAMQGLVNQDERPFTAEERAELNEALDFLRKHVRNLDALSNMTLGVATMVGFGVGCVFAKLML